MYISGEHNCHLVSRPLLPPQSSGLFLQGKYNTLWYLCITWNPNRVKLLSCNAIGISTLGQDSCLQEGMFCLYLGINMFLLEKCGHVSQKLGRFSGSKLNKHQTGVMVLITRKLFVKFNAKYVQVIGEIVYDYFIT